MDYPKMLYKHRGYHPMGQYRQIEGNLYEDITCFCHTNCRITVKPVGDHFELESLVNESARQFHGYHEMGCSDTHFYADEFDIKLVLAKRRVEDLKKLVHETERYLAEAQEKLSQIKPVAIRPQEIEMLDFGQKIYLTNSDTECIETTIESKVYNSNGLAFLISESGHRVNNTNEKDYLKVTIAYFDEDNECDEEKSYLGFLSEEDITNYKNFVERESWVAKVKYLGELLKDRRKRLEADRQWLSELKEKRKNTQ